MKLPRLPTSRQLLAQLTKLAELVQRVVGELSQLSSSSSEIPLETSLKNQREKLQWDLKTASLKIGIPTSFLAALESGQPLYPSPLNKIATTTSSIPTVIDKSTRHEQGYRRLLMIKYARGLDIPLESIATQLPPQAVLKLPKEHFLHTWNTSSNRKKWTSDNLSNLLLKKSSRVHKMKLAWAPVKKFFFFLTIIIMALLLWDLARHLYRGITSHPHFNQEGVLQIKEK